MSLRGGGCCLPPPESAAGQEGADPADAVFFTLSQATPTDGGAALCAVLQLLLLARDRADAPPPPETDGRASAVLRYLRAHFAEPVTVEQVAAETHLSKYHLCRLFRAHTGLSIVQYLTELRLTHARGMLLRTDRTVAEIA